MQQTTPIPERRPPLRTAVDINLGEAGEVILSDGSTASVRVLGMEAQTDSLRGAVRYARVDVQVNGETASLVSAAYHLPITVGGVQIDCPIAAPLLRKTTRDDPWRLEHDVRLRLWPADSPWIAPGTFLYPAKQRWFATDTQMCNEPCFVGGAEYVGTEYIYYHDGLDIGGAEGDTEVVASGDGTVFCAGDDFDEKGREQFELQPRYDRVHFVDDRDWVHLYSHLKEIDPAVRVGGQVKQGQRIGLLGKEGSSGGWAHLHFGIKCMQPSGRLGQEFGYAFLWQAYLAQYQPEIIAVARPHHFVRTGETVVLDASQSWCRDPAGIATCEWRFCDGNLAIGQHVKRCYDTPGIYSEIVTVRDHAGNESVDFAVVQVLEDYAPEHFPPGIHAAYSPSFGIRPGTPVRFKVRAFKVPQNEEIWDFGDGTKRVSVSSVPYGNGADGKHAQDGYAAVEHAYERPGNYIATAERIGPNGLRAVARVYVTVEE